MNTPNDRLTRRPQVVVGSGQTDEARVRRPAPDRASVPGRLSRLAAGVKSLLMAAAVIGFLVAALVLGSLVALLLVGVVSIVLIITMIRLALRRRDS
jgi:hypothetical protein